MWERDKKGTEKEREINRYSYKDRERESEMKIERNKGGERKKEMKIYIHIEREIEKGR